MANKDKNQILDEMRKRGYRITEQRRILVDILSKQECASCKEVYYEATKRDPSIGIATVYRTVSALQEMGILRQDYSRSSFFGGWKSGKQCRILSESGKKGNGADEEALYQEVKQFLKKRGYLNQEEFQMTVVLLNEGKDSEDVWQQRSFA